MEWSGRRILNFSAADLATTNGPLTAFLAPVHLVAELFQNKAVQLVLCAGAVVLLAMILRSYLEKGIDPLVRRLKRAKGKRMARKGRSNAQLIWRVSRWGN